MKTYFLSCFIKKWFHILVYHFNMKPLAYDKTMKKENKMEQSVHKLLKVTFIFVA